MVADRLGGDAGVEQALGAFDEAADEAHHDGLARRTGVAVVHRIGGLAQEALVDQLGADEHEPLARGHGVAPDDAGHALQTGLVFQEGQEAPTQLLPARTSGVVPPAREVSGDQTVGLQGVDGRIEARLRPFGIEAPERADVASGVRGHGLGEVARRRADRTEQRD